MSDMKKMPKLARLLRNHEDEIVAAWAEKAHSIPDSHYQNQKKQLEEVTQWTSQGLDVIIQTLNSGSRDAFEPYLKKITSNRLQHEFPIYEVTEAFLFAKETILPIILRSYPVNIPDIFEAIIQLDICLRYMTRHFGILFSEATHSQLLDETNQRLNESESIKRTMMALLQKLTLDEVLEIVCSEARQLMNATGSAILLLENEWLRVTFSTGNPLPVLERLSVTDSLAGIAVAKGQPLLFNDPASQKQAYHRNSDLQSLIVIPLYVKGMSIGVLDVVNKPGGFSNDDIRIMSLFADQAAIGIESARLYQQAEQLAVINERQRLARDLHDSVTQTMYSLSLYVDATQKALHRNRVKKASEHLDELRKLVKETMLDLRLLIFELHPPILQKEGLATALKTRLRSVESRSGIQTDCQVFNERKLPLETETELYRIVQESLTNVVKHAKADRVSLMLHYYRDKFKLQVQDNGIGFDLDTASKGGGLGLRGIQERVQRMKGSYTVESTPQTGTTLEIVIDI